MYVAKIMILLTSDMHTKPEQTESDNYDCVSVPYCALKYG